MKIKYDAIGRAIEAIKLCLYGIEIGELKKSRRVERILEELREIKSKEEEFESAPVLRVAVCETRGGDWIIEILQNQENKLFRIKYTIDEGESNIEIPYERLAQLKAALDDVIWAKQKFIPIPDKNS